MKVNIAIDCTPEELRRLMGLPDVSGLNQRFAEAMEKAAEEAMPGAEELGRWMRTWLAQAENAQQSLSQWMKAFQAASSERDG